MIQPKHPIDMMCTVCGALEETICAITVGAFTPPVVFIGGNIGGGGMAFHLARVHAATAANQIAELLEERRSLDELVELQHRTLERALRRLQDRPSAADRDGGAYTARRLTADDLATIAEVLRVTIDDRAYPEWRARLSDVRTKMITHLGDLQHKEPS